MQNRRGNSAEMAIALIVVLALLGGVAEAFPKTRTVKDHRRGNLLLPNTTPQCPHTVPCGWALYHQRSSSALRPIYEYTRNTFCSCAPERECVYQENRSDMRAYVFYCRDVSGESERDVYRFPNTR